MQIHDLEGRGKDNEPHFNHRFPVRQVKISTCTTIVCLKPCDNTFISFLWT